MRTLQIAPPLAFSETGQRKNNEDYFLPPDPSGQHRLFVVCDGMGGLDKGEEASQCLPMMVPLSRQIAHIPTIDPGQ